MILRNTISSLLISIMLFILFRLMSSLILIIEVEQILVSIYLSVSILILGVVLYRGNIKYNLRYFKVVPSPFFIKRKIAILDKILIVIVAYLSDIILTNSFKGLQDLTKNNNQMALENIYEKQNVYVSLLNNALVPSIMEEFVYRGLVYAIVITITSYYLKRENNKTIIIVSMVIFIIVSSILFGYIHVRDYVQVGEFEFLLPYMITGLIYGLVYAITRNISLVIGLHFLNNSINVLRFHIVSSVMDSVYTIILFIVIIIIGLKVLKYLYRDRINKIIKDVSSKHKK